MVVNSSSFPNASYPASPLSSSSNIYFFLQKCFSSSAGAFTISTFIIVSLFFLLPLSIFIIYHGLQRWHLQRSSTTMSHSSFITYQVILTELLSISGTTLICCGVYTNIPQMIMAGIYFWSVNFSGQMFFHTLTCVERYLAVVHPVTYLSLRKAKGIRIRNITIGCVWLMCFARTGLLSVTDQVSNLSISICTISGPLIVISFCSLSVLHVLRRPGPGDEGGGRQRVDQSKLRAFYTIMAILGVLLFRFGGAILAIALTTLPQLGDTERCYVWYSVVWFSLPSSLVLPLLFLLRAGKLVCCINNNTS